MGQLCAFFPVDDEAIEYLRLTGRDEEHIQLVKKYLELNDMYFTPDKEDPIYTDVIELDLSTIEANVSVRNGRRT